MYAEQLGGDCAQSRNGEGTSEGGYRGLGPGLREREEARAGAAAEDDGRHGVRADVPPRRRRSGRRLGARVLRLLHLARTTNPKR